MEALRIQPAFAVAWSNLASLFMDAGDLNRALQYYKVWSTLYRSVYYLLNQRFGFILILPSLFVYGLLSSHYFVV